MMTRRRCTTISMLQQVVTVCYRRPASGARESAILYSKSMNNKHILVVDDDPGLRELLQQYLSEQGYSVDAVADGSRWRRHLAEHAADLVILDLMLPERTG